MNSKYLDDAVRFAVLMGREFPRAGVNQFTELMRLARRHGRMMERACNVPVKANHADKCEEAIKILCNQIGCRVDFGGDPRGYTVKVFLPSGTYNTWGGAESGWGVPQ